MTMSNNIINAGQFGDTTLTKVFVGGLAWETPKECMKEHFDKYGDILEAVIISDKITGRSKGYGFVTFKEAEAAKRACEDATPVINGRRANCNLASLGARRPRASSTPPPQHHGQGPNVGPRSTTTPAPASHVQWYYPAGTTASPFHHQAVPYYGYSPTYVTADGSYNHKLSYTGGSYMNMNMNGQYYGAAGGQGMMGTTSTLMPMYAHHHHQQQQQQPVYHHYHQSQAMGLPAHHLYSPVPTIAGPMTKLPVLLSKPTSINVPSPVCLAVE
ncbi:hypothetical protein LguiB_003398 [Lonicera macranthoides]